MGPALRRGHERRWTVHFEHGANSSSKALSPKRKDLDYRSGTKQELVGAGGCFDDALAGHDGKAQNAAIASSGTERA
jgi:hypothetical protein